VDAAAAAEEAAALEAAAAVAMEAAGAAVVAEAEAEAAEAAAAGTDWPTPGGAAGMLASGRCLHSSTSQLNVSTRLGDTLRWLVRDPMASVSQ